VSDVAVESPDAGKTSTATALKRAIWMLTVATAIAMVVAAAIFGFVFHAEFLTGAAASIVDLMFEHAAIAVAVAASPLFAALLVGYGYMLRGMRRRAAEKAKAAATAGAAGRRP
jgi:hypothetical protein